MDDVTQQVNLIVESLLENESLTSNLDDTAAQVLLNWGIASTERIVRGVVGLTTVEAEQVMYQQLRATRRLMRYINRWVPTRHEMTPQKNLSKLEQITQQAAIIYPDNTLPDESRLSAFIEQSSAYSPEQTITELRRLVEEPPSRSLDDDITSNDLLDAEPSQKQEELIASSEEDELMGHDESISEEQLSDDSAKEEGQSNNHDSNSALKEPTDSKEITQIEPSSDETESPLSPDDVTPDEVSIHLSEQAPTTQALTYQYPVVYKDPQSTGLWGVVMNVVRSMTSAYHKLFSLEGHS